MPSYDGDATFFRAIVATRPILHTDVHDTWNRLITGRLDFIPVPGGHSQIIREPYVGALARELEKALNAARANVDGEEQGTGTWKSRAHGALKYVVEGPRVDR